MKTGLLRNRVQILPGLGCCDLNQFTSHASGTPLTADRKISLGAVKHLVDGSLQCYTGCLSNPYHKIIYDLPDGPMWRGYIQENPEGFIDRIVGFASAGLADRHPRQRRRRPSQIILNAYEEAQKALSPRRRPAHHHPLPDRARGSARPHRSGSAWCRRSSSSTPISGATAIGTSSSARTAPARIEPAAAAP